MKNTIKSRLCEIILGVIMCLSFIAYSGIVFIFAYEDLRNIPQTADYCLSLGLTMFALLVLRPCLVAWWQFTEKHPNWREERAQAKRTKQQIENALIIGSSGSGKVRQIILPHKCVNVELHNTLIQSLSIKNRYDIFDIELTTESILQAMYECREYLMQMEHHINLTDCHRNEKKDYMSMNGKIDIQPLTSRQSFCANTVIKYIANQRWGNALHEFLDCIDNFGECGREPRLITINEYVLYSCLIQAFVSALKEQQL